MKLSELFAPRGRGVIATSSAEGVVNVAVYAIPHLVDEKTCAWGMTEGRTHKNIMENPHAAYLYLNPGGGFSGARLGLRLIKIEESGEMLTLIRKRTAELVSPHAATLVKHVAYFEVTEVRPLI